jgi:ABC-type glycerol-3-phosphate transport system permease component
MTTSSVEGAAQAPGPAAGTATTVPPARARAARAGPVRSARSASRRRRRNSAQIYVLLMALAVLFAGPFVWLVLAAVKTQAEWVAVPPRILPESPQWSNFVHAFTDINFPAYAANSLFLSTVYAVLVTLSSAAVGFGFARLRGWGKRPLFVVVLSTMMLPQILTLIPTYVLFARVGLVNTYWPWVLWGLGAAPFLVFLFRQFFAAIPAELEDAAIMDGCGYGRIFVRIFLPLSRPVLMTSFLLSFTWVWGDFIAPQLLLDVDHTTLSVAIASWYRDPHGNPIATVQAAAATLYVIPVLLIFLFAQRYFIRGVVTSGIKG